MRNGITNIILKKSFNMNANEELFFTTTRIIAIDGLSQSIGTAFFFQLEVDGKAYPLLITNKHVLFYKTKVSYLIELHSDSSEKEIVSVNLGDWFFHEKEDLAFTFINPVIAKHFSLNGKKLKNIFLTEKNMISEKDLRVLNPVEDVFMIGYPKGLYDSKSDCLI